MLIAFMTLDSNVPLIGIPLLGILFFIEIVASSDDFFEEDKDGDSVGIPSSFSFVTSCALSRERVIHSSQHQLKAS